MKESSSIAPDAHHSALFFIHVGITFIFSSFKIDWEFIWKLDVDTKNFSKLLVFLPVKINLNSYSPSFGIKIDSWWIPYGAKMPRYFSLLPRFDHISFPDKSVIPYTNSVSGTAKLFSS